jgi:hypothetical protein
MQACQKLWSWRIKFVTGPLIGLSPTPEAAHSTTTARPRLGTGGRRISRNVHTPGCSTLRTGSVNTTRWWTVGTENCQLENVSIFIYCCQNAHNIPVELWGLIVPVDLYDSSVDILYDYFVVCYDCFVCQYEYFQLWMRYCFVWLTILYGSKSNIFNYRNMPYPTT